MSQCILFFSYGDKKTIEFLIDQGEGDISQKERQKDNLRQMVNFCENKSDCRRKTILEYFGETFDTSLCKATCDNCKHNTGNCKIENVTELSIVAAELVRNIQNQQITLSYCVDILRGSRISKIRENNHDTLPMHGAGKALTKSDADRLYKELISKNILRENVQLNAKGFICSYIKTGPEFGLIYSSNWNLKMALSEEVIPVESKKKNNRKKNYPSNDYSANQDTTYSGNDVVQNDEKKSIYFKGKTSLNGSSIVPTNTNIQCFSALKELRARIMLRKKCQPVDVKHN
jgi:superfamily II DNA helicase RecQ